MAVYSIKMVQRIPVPLQEAWTFFSNPDKLALITPAFLRFKVISRHHSDRIYPGQLIEYKVRPVFGIEVYWMTEITHVQERQYFVDEQRYGPYKLWHHQHHFREVDGVVEMTDIVHYKVPGWLFGGLINSLLVHPTLKQLFQFRYQKVEELLGKCDGQECRIVFS